MPKEKVTEISSYRRVDGDSPVECCLQCIHSNGVDLLEFACMQDKAMCVCYILEEAQFVGPRMVCDNWKDFDGTVFRGDVLHKEDQK